MQESDVLLIGGGVMSAHLGVLLKLIDPTLRIQVLEAAGGFAQESSNGWHNAGTGHAGLCELSYTPEQSADGTVDVTNAINIFQKFEDSLQFWAYAVEMGIVGPPAEFINPVPHLSFVTGRKDIGYLRSRHTAMARHHFFEGIEFSEDRAEVSRWAPLLLEGRGHERVAATRMSSGTDVDFGGVSRQLFSWLGRQPDCGLACNHTVVGLKQTTNGWEIRARDSILSAFRVARAKFIFVGAGGGSLRLLQQAGIPEAEGLGGFPIGGQWLVCDNPALVERHEAKVYGQPLPAAPTMAVPHLDTRVLDGKKTLLFGPFAKWTTRFLHRRGHWSDLPQSVRIHNIATLLRIGWRNLDLVRYLLQQGSQSMDDRLELLRLYCPAARKADWRLIDAGIRVQAIKKIDGESGIVHYGTEVITNTDRSLAALLGASPGASVCVSIALEIIHRCHPAIMTRPASRDRLNNIIPEFGIDLRDPTHAALFRRTHARALKTLRLN